MSLFDTYIGRVGRQLGTNRLFVAATGFFNVGDVSGGADGTDITGAQLKYMLISPMTRTSVTMSAASTQTISVIAASCGLVHLYAIGAAGSASTTTSVKLPVANLGATLLLNFVATHSQVSILAGTSASLAIGTSDLSCILITGSGVSGIWLEFMCITANEWQVARGELIHGQFAGMQRS